MDDVGRDASTRHPTMHDTREGGAGDAAPPPGGDGGRRQLLGSLGAAGLAVMAGLGLQATTAEKKRKGKSKSKNKHTSAGAEHHRNGKNGKNGKQGPKGPTGPTGPAGSGSGSEGATGPTGPTGPTGLTGPAGPSGDAGEAGTPGQIGPQGITGPDGAAGPQGEPGPSAGTMYWARVDDNGNLIGSYGVDRVEDTPGQNGTYVVHFTNSDQNFGVCAVTALADRLLAAIQASTGHGFIIFQTAQSGFLVNEGFSCIVVCPAT